LNFLKSELGALKRFLPGLTERLQATSFEQMERPGNPALALFREAGGPGLLIPTAVGGLGASPLDALQVHRALGYLSPSLAIAATMHNFSSASLVAMAQDPSGLALTLLEQIAKHRLYVASGVAEGRPGASALSSSLQVRRSKDGIVVSGSKKPCCLSASMDFLTASLSMPEGGAHAGELAFGIIPAQTPGIERRPFWKSPVLAGAESDEVILNNVEVGDTCLCYLDAEGRLLEHGFLWFEVLISASYLGIVDGLLFAVFSESRGNAADRAMLGSEHEAAMAGLEAVAHGMMAPQSARDLLPRALSVRYAIQKTIERTSAQAAELLGGLAFVSQEEFALRYAAARMLAFHPPTRLAGATALDEFFLGGSLILR
jgi:alkylation response protein AidB-like acyl-CoA dehydrogenase